MPLPEVRPAAGRDLRLRASGLENWPRRGVWRAVENMERYLSLGDDVFPIVGHRSALRPPRGTLPGPLIGVVRRLGEVLPERVDLRTEIDHAAAETLWETSLRLAAESPDPRIASWARSPRQLSAWKTLLLLSDVVARSMRYPSLPIAERKDEERLPLAFVRKLLGVERSQRWRQKLQGAELIRASLATYHLDLMSVGKMATRALRGDLQGVCRHYAMLLQVLFFAAKRATGLHRCAHVLTLGGSPDLGRWAGHAWTWFVDEGRDRIVALDVTGADWVMDRNGVPHVTNDQLDGTGFNNVSTFLNTLLGAFAQGFLTPTGLEGILPRLIRLETMRGQAILYRFAHQSRVHPEVRSRIEATLARKGLDARLPGWRIPWPSSESWFSYLAPAPVQHAFLDALGLPGGP